MAMRHGQAWMTVGAVTTGSSRGNSGRGDQGPVRIVSSGAAEALKA
jgi:hypothetical protein